jgi:ABC-type glycerol-3-phosphate transport system permease component
MAGLSREGEIRIGGRGWAAGGASFVAAAAVMFFMAAPVAWIFIASFQTTATLFSDGPAEWTLENYRTIWEADFGTYIFNSLFMCLVAVTIVTVIGVAAAYVFSRYRFRGKRAVFGAVVLGQLFPWIILVTPLFIMFAQLGLLNSYGGMIFCYTAIALPFSVYLMVGYLESVPRDLDEAAFMDGCSRLQVLRHVVFPLMLPGIVATATYSFLLMWTEYLFALAFLTKTSMKTMPLGLALFFGEDAVDWGAVMAASAVTTLPALMLFIPLQTRLVSGMTSGAVKG